MRTKLAGLFIVLVAILIAVLAYVLWPSSSPDSSTTTRPTTSQSSENQPPLNPARPLSQEPQIDTGRVINGITIDIDGRPLANVEILHRLVSTARQQSCYELNIELQLNNSTEFIVSDTQGVFTLPYSFETTEDGSNHCLIVSASKPDYATTTVALPVTLEQVPDQIDIELSPSKTLRGTVLNPDNDPIAGARVSAWTVATDDTDAPCVVGGPEFPVTADTLTAGSFALEVAEDAHYCIQAFHPDWSRSDTYFISRNDSAENLQLRLSTRQQLTGVVVDLDEQPVANLTLQLHSSHRGAPPENLTATTDANGEVIFNNVDTGVYELTSLNPQYQIAEPKTVNTTAAQSDESLHIKVFPVTVITGRVFAPSGQPLAGVTVSARSPYAANETLNETSSDGSGYFELVSLHRSEAAYEHFKMAGAFVESTQGRPTFAGAVCIDFYHPRYRATMTAVSATTPTIDLGETHLQTPVLEISGRVVNHRDEPTPATLVFTSHASQESKPLEVRLPECGDLYINRKVSANEDGQFNAALDTPGRYEIEILTDKYKNRTIEKEFFSSSSGIEIKID